MGFTHFRAGLSPFFAPAFCRVDAHNPGDPEHCDFLWIEYTPTDPGYEGTCLQIHRYPEPDGWHVNYELMYTHGGTATNWEGSGSEDEVIAKLSDFLMQKGSIAKWGVKYINPKRNNRAKQKSPY
jgi:hypothetical protein